MTTMPVFPRRVVVLLAVTTLPAVLLAANGRDAGQSLVGKTLPPYPPGLDEIQGSCLPGGPALAQACDHAIAVIGQRSADPERPALPRWIVASRNLDRDAVQPRWRVIDATAAPKPRAGYELQIGSCRLDGVDAPGIVAHVRHRGDDEISRDVRWARRYDLATGKLVVTAPRQVACINEGFGL
jgi:hypothetical protein